MEESPAVRMDSLTTPDGVTYTLTDYGRTIQTEVFGPGKVPDCDDPGILLSSQSRPRYIALRQARFLLMDSDVREILVTSETDEQQPELPFVDPPWKRDTPPESD